ncbi:MAG: hypothetical protein A3C55_03545 [Gammaproteobacteria bacterium RIFCSPHIGHO2_02_FULL_42_13]|nr:MAG: hypothetical protein A3C55_03545 [Gammaproteobacteria bacterium RIFCSPHIGHO2_02_FULL_42_13]OGT69229.1 MAG: hypothetical protein A3H43_03290 [Gammaproteobacteria bacterium RIFCSPLOWO2_02_FULL_42_9]
MKEQLLSYSSILELLGDETRSTLPAELHGFICGVLAGNGKLDEAQKFKLMTDLLAEEIEYETLPKEIVDLILTSKIQLQDADFEFQLLLPSDDDDLAVRLTALALWCQSFVEGLGMSGLQQSAIERANLSEAIQDLTEIANVSTQNLDDDETVEFDFLAVMEHVRASALLIHMENATKIEETAAVH